MQNKRKRRQAQVVEGKDLYNVYQAKQSQQIKDGFEQAKKYVSYNQE